MIIVLVALAAVAVGVTAGYWLRSRRRQPASVPRGTSATRQILLPFTGRSVSRRAFDAALRLARIEGATLMPTFIVTVPMSLSMDSPLPRQCTVGMPLLEALEQRALAQGIAVDSRIVRGRSYRDALRRMLGSEHFDRVIISASDDPRVGLTGEDILWVLERAEAEILILRPAPQDTRVVSAAGISGHF
jgi:nucleotide-binding universal stress UspA family protein